MDPCEELSPVLLQALYIASIPPRDAIRRRPDTLIPIADLIQKQASSNMPQ